MTSGHFRRTGNYVPVCALVVIAAFAPSWAQSPRRAGSATVQGYVRDSVGTPVAKAAVFLTPSNKIQPADALAKDTHTDSEGMYRFAELRGAAYVLRVELNGHVRATLGPVILAEQEVRNIDLTLTSAETKADAKPGTSAPDFFDEPQFTVAGVTQATNSGGHGSDTVLRATEALAKATVSLSDGHDPQAKATPPAATEDSLRDSVKHAPESFEANWQLGRLLAENGKASEALPYLEHAHRLSPQDPGVLHLLGDVEEKLGNPLEAVRDYQRAAELDPSEANLFDWGTELLTHRALEPATEVFTKGNQLFPKSVRTLVALSVAWYARGSYDQAAQFLMNASDIAPDNPTPYLFLGQMQTVEVTPLEGSVERLARFAQLQPNNALANYYYAVSLWRQSATSEEHNQQTTQIESLLQKAVALDPQLGAAYLQLGILYSQRTDFARAISAYQKAIEVSPPIDTPQPDGTLEEAHYRLAQDYLRMGKKIKAQEQLQLHNQSAMKTKGDAERSRRQVQQFVVLLRSQGSASPPQN